MKRALVVAVGGVILSVQAGLAATPSKASADWNAFVTRVKRGQLSKADVRPYAVVPAQTLVGFANTILKKAPRSRLASPEVFVVGELRHYVVKLGTEPKPSSFCFSFVRQGGRHYLRHIENIFIRLDRIEKLPTSRFPPLPSDRLDWMREEIRVTEMVRLFRFLKKEKGAAFAFDHFRDGKGYALAARTWVPFVEPHRAFVLYLCWMQTHLRGGKATLLSLTDARATVRLEPLWLPLYQRTAHLRHQIARRDLRKLFETIWTDRARHAGWKIRVACDGDRSCQLSLWR